MDLLPENIHSNMLGACGGVAVSSYREESSLVASCCGSEVVTACPGQLRLHHCEPCTLGQQEGSRRFSFLFGEVRSEMANGTFLMEA